VCGYAARSRGCDLAVGELLYISLLKVIGTNYNKNNQITQLGDSHIILK